MLPGLRVEPVCKRQRVARVESFQFASLIVTGIDIDVHNGFPNWDLWEKGLQIALHCQPFNMLCLPSVKCMDATMSIVSYNSESATPGSCRRLRSRFCVANRWK